MGAGVPHADRRHEVSNALNQACLWSVWYICHCHPWIKFGARRAGPSARAGAAAAGGRGGGVPATRRAQHSGPVRARAGLVAPPAVTKLKATEEVAAHAQAFLAQCGVRAALSAVLSAAQVYAVLEWLLCEVLELAHNRAQDSWRPAVVPRDIRMAVYLDQELCAKFGRCHDRLAGLRARSARPVPSSKKISAWPGPAPHQPGPAPELPGPTQDQPGPAPEVPAPAPELSGPTPDQPRPGPELPGGGCTVLCCRVLEGSEGSYIKEESEGVSNVVGRPPPGKQTGQSALCR